ncbi:Protein kinase domain protein [Planctomycetes bacterium CA13]|uniref:Protein kinase domain protein n=1 Tax=Novipirellula herctigrandis TaxID=2527986 RepID=A0A5C5Z293_9BACT|nr:Protein kinase domain protein [Planctomycetes bacterium CA13]
MSTSVREDSRAGHEVSRDHKIAIRYPRQNLIHRDIKPANLFSANRGGMYDVAKLLDFGLVRQSGLAASHDHRFGGI